MTNGWKKRSLAELCVLISGRHLDPKQQNTESRGIGYLTGPADFGLLNPVISRWTEDPQALATQGDILITVKGAGVGKINLLDVDSVAISRQLMAVRVTDGDHRFIYAFLGSQFEHFQSMGSGATVPGLSREDVLDLQIPFPPLSEQRRIVGILDEAFEGLATAKANAEQNLQNARALFESHLQAVFTQRGDGEQEPRLQTAWKLIDATTEDETLGTKTGGRDATTRHILPKLALAVGMPSSRPSKNWTWTPLSALARLESGHTPSRRHPEYWDGTVPWIGIKDARQNHGQTIDDTEQKTNNLGLANSSARLLPKGTVCLSRTASVGYVVVMGQPMATSQDFVNWVCSDKLIPEFLKYLFLAEGREGFLRYSSGSVHQTIYYPEAKAFHIAHPDTEEQGKIVRQCDVLRVESQRLESIYQRKLAVLDELKKSLLHRAFSGQL